MANLRIRINNLHAIKEQFPKLRRSLNAQEGVEVIEEGHGVYLLVVKDRDLKSLKRTLESIKGHLDNNGFRFFYGDDEEEERQPGPENFIEDCDCEQCRYERDRWNKYQAFQKQQQDLREAAQKRRQNAEAARLKQIADAQQVEEAKKKTIKQLLEEAVRTMNEAKKKRAAR